MAKDYFTNEKIEELFNSRYTCKGYDPEMKVSDRDFHTIMEAARLSPSSMGFEPWKFVLLNNQQVKDEIYPFSWGAQAALDGASHFVLLLARVPEDMKPGSKYLAYIQEEIQHYPAENMADRRARFERFIEEDFKLSESDRAFADWIASQSYIPLANMLTTAAALGVDSTPIEGFNREKVHEVLVRHGVYNPEHFRIVSMIAFGYSNRNHRPKTRRPLDEVLEVFE